MNHEDPRNMTTRGGDDLQQWIDDLLRSSTAADLEAAPGAALVGAAAAINKFRRRQRAARSLAVFAAAAAVFVAVMTWRGAPRRGGERLGEGLIAPVVVQAPDASATIENPSPNPSLRGRGIGPTATFLAGDESIAIELDSPADDVTVMQVYTTTDAQRRLELEHAFQSQTLEQPGG